MQFKAQIGNTTFNKPFLNASGVYCQTKDELNAVLNNENSGGVITKSATKASRLGNPSPRYYYFGSGSINSMGLPNNGLKYYLDYVTNDELKKPSIVSVAGTSPKENMELLKQIKASDYNGLTELNLSCPNVPGKAQAAYDFSGTNELLKEIFAFFDQPLGLKLPPYLDLAHFDQIADVLNQFPITHITTINSVGNGLWIDDEKEQVVIKPKQGFGGLGGQMVLPTALANVYGLRKRLKDSIKIIGTGGITKGSDVFEHFLCGADLVSVGTQLANGGPKVFDRLNDELLAIMQRKGYHSINEFKGNLKSMD